MYDFNNTCNCIAPRHGEFEMSSNKLVLIRGIPGSGKSTLAKEIESDYGFEHIETDMYFTDKFGEYDFDRTKVKEAHEWCFAQVEDLLFAKKDVVVSNTFVKFKDIEPYFKLSKKYNYNFAVIKCINTFGNIHNVPESVIENMTAQFENISGEVIRNV